MTTNQLTQITIKNYRSIADLTVSLPRLMVLVGRNASGKSNFVDALRFVRDAMSPHGTVEHTAIYLRGSGLVDLVNAKQASDSILSVSFSLTFRVAKRTGRYAFTLMQPNGEPPWNSRLEVTESLEVENQVLLDHHHSQWNQAPVNPPPDMSGIVLPLFSGVETIRPVFRLLRDMAFYTPVPRDERYPQVLKSGYPYAAGEDSNFVSALKLFLESSPWVKDFQNSVRAILPHVDSVEVIPFGEFYKIRVTHISNVRLGFEHESDGTVRILALLLALYQDPAPSLLVIEEPELYAHPGALPYLCDIIRETSLRCQVIVTTHSPEMLNYFDVENIRVVERTDAGTQIGEVTAAQKETIQERLFTASELIGIDGELRRASLNEQQG